MSVVLGMQFKVALGMIAGRADLGGFRAHHDMAAVAAFPHLYFASGEDFGRFHVPEQRPVALLMVFFHRRHQAEAPRQLREPFLFGGSGKTVVHVRPLVVLAFGGVEQVLRRIAEAVEFLEPELGVFLFVLRRFQKQRRNLLVACLLYTSRCV